MAHEAGACFLAEFLDAIGRSAGRLAHRVQRLRAREQQVAFDEMREPEVGIGLQHLIDFDESDVGLVVLDREQRFHEERFRLHSWMPQAALSPRLATGFAFLAAAAGSQTPNATANTATAIRTAGWGRSPGSVSDLTCGTRPKERWLKRETMYLF